MKIILTFGVRRLGNIGDVVEVRNGYARNYLIPQKKAIVASKENIKSFEAKKQVLLNENQERSEKAKRVTDAVGEIVVVLLREASEDGKLYGSVSVKDIVDGVNDVLRLNSVDFEIGKSSVILKNPIKFLGIHDINLELHSDVTMQAKVNVARTVSEADLALKKLRQDNIAASNEKSEYKVKNKKVAKEEVTDANTTTDDAEVS